MNRQQILAEIKRVAFSNGGRPPGTQALGRECGMRKSDWYPHMWLRWSDALAEAGYAPNTFQTRTSDETLFKKYIELVRELRRLPIEGEIRRKAKIDTSFPNHGAFARFGGKQKMLSALAEYCRKTTGLQDVHALCVQEDNTSGVPSTGKRRAAMIPTEFFYLMKSGPHYKIGRTNSIGRRGSELAIKIPVPPTTVHSIETDDPVGVEAYWHRRFDEKRGEGEWFSLSPDDVTAFKRWKRIV